MTNFSQLAAEQKVRILMELRGAAQFVTQMNAAAVATARMAEKEAMLAKATQGANAMSFVQRQGLYTLRRYTFYATLGITGLAYSVGRLGLSYYNTTQTAMVGFTGLLHSQKAARKELDYLYVLAARTPFEFTDVVKAARLIQPYANSLALTNQTVTDLTNTLSAAGQLTGSAMQRAALQMSHMFTIGRLTGQVLLALSRDFVPMNLALQRYLHLTGEQVRQQVAAGLIDAKTAAKALHDYIMADSGRSLAGFNQATKTLVGSWSTLKDLLGMSAASAEGGIFETLRKSIKGIDQDLLKMTDRGRHITMMDFIGAVDKSFSPQSHVIINFFVLLTSTIKTMATEFYILYRAVTIMFYPLDLLGRLFGHNMWAVKALGIVMGTWMTVLILAKTRVMLLTEAEVIATLVQVSWGKSIIFTTRAMKIMNLLITGQLLNSLRKWAFAEKSIGRSGAFVNNGRLAVFSRLLLTRTVPAIIAATTAMWSFVAANIALISFWGILIVAVVVLYFKWGLFHKAVNDLWRDIIIFSPVIGAALAYAFGPIGVAVMGLLLFIRYWRQIKDMTAQVATAVTPAGQHATGRAHHQNWFEKNVENPFKVISGFADGGTAGRRGNYMVGERGREILTLPGGSKVTPLDNSSLHGTIHIEIHPQAIYMDAKKVGESLAEVVTDAQARQ